MNTYYTQQFRRCVIPEQLVLTVLTFHSLRVGFYGKIITITLLVAVQLRVIFACCSTAPITAIKNHCISFLCLLLCIFATSCDVKIPTTFIIVIYIVRIFLEH